MDSCQWEGNLMQPSTSCSLDVPGTTRDTRRGGWCEDLPFISHELAGGHLLPSQLPSPCYWSPERKLAAAVLASALTEIRDHHDHPHYRRHVAGDLEWVYSEDSRWPFSFLRLCDVLGLEPAWVRERVERWRMTPKRRMARRTTPYRNAA
jgi:hypothetical protein